MSSRRRWKSILWTLIAVMAVFLVARLLGTIAIRWSAAQRQAEAIQQVRALKGHCYYDFQIVDEGLATETLMDADDPDADPHWMSSLMGLDYCHDVVYVTFSQFDGVPDDGATTAIRADVTDQDLQLLTAFPKLRWLAASGTAITDDAVAQIADAFSLNRFWCGQTQITDESMRSLSAVDSLTHLAIEQTVVSDVGMTFVAQMQSLQSLSIGCPRVTASGLQLVGDLRELRELYVDQMPIGNAMGAIAQLTNLKVLSARRTGLNDAQADMLRALENIRVLHLDDTLIGDQGLLAAEGWTELEQLTLTRTLITDEGLARLAPCVKLSRLDVSQTQCTLGGILHLLRDQIGQSLEQSLEIAFQTHFEGEELVSLDFTGIHIRDGDMAVLAELPSLQWLNIPGSNLTNLGIQQLSQASLPDLRLLKINDADVDDAGLIYLAALPALRDLHVINTRITDAGIATLRERNRRLRVYRNPLGPGGN